MADNLLPEIRKAFREADKSLAGTQERFKADIARIFDGFTRQLRRYLKTPDFVSPSDARRLTAAIKVRADILDMLQSAGFDQFVADYQEMFPIIAREALQQFAVFDAPVTMSGVSTKALDALIEQQTFLMRNLVNNQVVEPLMQHLFSSIVADTSIETLISNVSLVADNLSTKQVETLVSDSFAQFNRITTRLRADELGFDLYVWLGPQDEATSEQCQALFDEAPYGVAGVWKKDDISADMVDGLQGDPFIMGGHWNCRHEFRPLDTQTAIDMGFKDEN